MKYTYCETIAAIGPWHIRLLDERGKMPSGISPRGVRTLCGREAAWDINANITAERLVGPDTTCPRCSKNYTTVVLPAGGR